MKSLVAGIIGALRVIFSTYLTEKRGTKIGGIVGTLPSTLLVIMVFVAFTQGVDIASKSSNSIVYGLVADVVFLLGYIITARLGVTLSICISLLGWLIAAYILGTSVLPGLWESVILYFILTILAVYFIEKGLKIKSQTGKKVKYGKTETLVRGLITFFMVFGVSYSSSFLQPSQIGIISLFPGMFISTMYILHTRRGYKFSQATAKTFILSVSNLIAYGLVIGFLYPTWGVVLGTVLACISSIIWAFFIKRVVSYLH